VNALIRFGEGTYRWLDERLGLAMVFKATAGHAIPRSVNWWYVFGSAVLTAFMFQVVTGIFLAFTYVPSPDHAYASLDYISHHQFLGNILRGLHYWGASAMVLLIFIHMTAHFLTGSYKFPRELHWLTGAVLLILTFTMAFTGQLLRWNQDAYWAISVGAEQASRTPLIGTWVGQLLLAGPAIGGQTLTRIYAIHIWLVPAGIFTFIGVHLYLVIYKGISEWPYRASRSIQRRIGRSTRRFCTRTASRFSPVGYGRMQRSRYWSAPLWWRLLSFWGPRRWDPRPTHEHRPIPSQIGTSFGTLRSWRWFLRPARRTLLSWPQR